MAPTKVEIQTQMEQQLGLRQKFNPVRDKIPDVYLDIAEIVIAFELSRTLFPDTFNFTQKIWEDAAWQTTANQAIEAALNLKSNPVSGSWMPPKLNSFHEHRMVKPFGPITFKIQK